MSRDELSIAEAEARAYKMEASRRWKRNNAARVLEYAAQYRAQHPDIIKRAEERRKLKKAAVSRRWREKTKELRRVQERARLRQYYAKNRETLLEKKRAKDAEKRARRTPEELSALRARWRKYRAEWKRKPPGWLAGQLPVLKGKAKAHIAE